jgi:hypothetical protein
MTIRRTRSVCCARAVSGNATAAPPSTAMNWPRLTQSPRRWASTGEDQTIFATDTQLMGPHFPRENVMKPSLFGIRTFGSVWALTVSFSPMTPLSCNKWATTEYTSSLAKDFGSLSGIARRT